MVRYKKNGTAILNTAERRGQHLRAAAKTIVHRVRSYYKFTVDHHEFMQLYMGREALDKVNAALQYISLPASDLEMDAYIQLAHPIYGIELFLRPKISLKAPKGTPCYWPKNKDVRFEDGSEVLATIKEMLLLLLELTIVKEAMLFVINNAKSHQQARYHMPCYMVLLKNCGYSQIASQIEHVTKAQPAIPNITDDMRKKIKFTNQWFAAQQLLGTMDVDGDRQRQMQGTCEVTLEGNLCVNIDLDDVLLDVRIEE